MMMPDFKPKALHVALVLCSTLVLSGCSMPSFMKMDAIDDTVDYRQSAKPISALAIPPGLSNPDFDATYAAQQGNNAGAAAAVSTATGTSLGAALMAQSSTDGQAQTRVAAAPKTAKTMAPSTTSSGSQLPQVAMIKLKGGEPALAINAPYAVAWKLLAPMLADVGFEVGKQQPNQGIITTTFKGAATTNLSNGQSYLILLAENASKQSFIGVADANGKPETEAVANAALTLIKAAFEK